MAIAIMGYGQPKNKFSRLADYPIKDLHWPLNDAPSVCSVGDLNKRDHLVMYSCSRAYSASRKNLSCRLSIFLNEPPAIQGRYYRLLRLIGNKYHRILTHNSDLLGRLPNARFIAHGGTSLVERHVDSVPKTSRISLIASKKKLTSGHRLRHRVAAWSLRHSPDLNLYGHGYSSIVDKRLAHSPYYFSVVIENSRCAGYFTEKLMDSFLCRCLPVYWGAPDIAHFFDVRGMICCPSESDLRAAIAELTIADYQRRIEFLEENSRRTEGFLDIHRNIAELLLNEDRLSNSALAPLRHAALEVAEPDDFNMTQK